MKINARNSEVKINLFILYHYTHYLATLQCFVIFNVYISIYILFSNVVIVSKLH